MTTLTDESPIPAQPTTPTVPPAPNGMTAAELGDHLSSSGAREVPVVESETINNPIQASTKYDSVQDGMDATREIARVASYREIDKIVIYVDSLDPVMLDRPEVKTAAYQHRLHYGLGNSGIEAIVAPYRVRLDDKNEKPTLYEPQPDKTIWRRVFHLNVGA